MSKSEFIPKKHEEGIEQSLDEISKDFPLLNNNNLGSDLAKSQMIPENSKILDENPQFYNNTFWKQDPIACLGKSEDQLMEDYFD